MSCYYKFLFEAELDPKNMNLNNFTQFNFNSLSVPDQKSFLNLFFKKYGISAAIRKSDNIYNKYFIIIQDENLCEQAVKKFSHISNIPRHGDTFVTNEATYIFTFNYDARIPLNPDGTRQDDNKDDNWLRRANEFRRNVQLGKRIFNHFTKPNLKTLNPEF